MHEQMVWNGKLIRQRITVDVHTARYVNSVYGSVPYRTVMIVLIDELFNINIQVFYLIFLHRVVPSSTTTLYSTLKKKQDYFENNTTLSDLRLIIWEFQ